MKTALLWDFKLESFAFKDNQAYYWKGLYFDLLNKMSSRIDSIKE